LTIKRNEWHKFFSESLFLVLFFCQQYRSMQNKQKPIKFIFVMCSLILRWFSVKLCNSKFIAEKPTQPSLANFKISVPDAILRFIFLWLDTNFNSSCLVLLMKAKNKQKKFHLTYSISFSFDFVLSIPRQKIKKRRTIILCKYVERIECPFHTDLFLVFGWFPLKDVSFYVLLELNQNP
jgi:hypothetical protein